MTLCHITSLAFIFYNLLSKENIIQLINITAFCFLRNYIMKFLQYTGAEKQGASAASHHGKSPTLCLLSLRHFS